MLVRLIVAAMIVVGCQTTQETVTAAQAQAPVPSLVGTSWIAADIDGRGTLDRARSTVTLEASQRLNGNTACNRYFGTYELGEGTLRLKPAGSTRMACEPPVMEQETRFLAALEAATAFRREGTDLLLLDASGRVRVRLTPAGPGARPTGPAPAGPPLLRAHAFDCADGPSIVARSPAEGAGRGETIDLVLPDGRRRLPRVPTASGERYAERGVSFWSKGREATLELDGRTHACTENRRRSITEDARLRGVELRAVGQEPGWTLELFRDRMAFVRGLEGERATTPRPAPQASLAAGETVYVAITEAHRLTVRIRETRCLDTMSGEGYEATVEVELDGRVYRGCGEALH
jgi:putative lipoprotein